jgi:acyl carrier protein
LSIESDVYGILTTILKHQGLPVIEIQLSSELYDNGIGLDSLCVAELSAMLEKKFGRDPYTSKVLPSTVQDVIDFYASDEHI